MSAIKRLRDVLSSEGFEKGMSAKEFRKKNRHGADKAAQFIESNLDELVTSISSRITNEQTGR